MKMYLAATVSAMLIAAMPAAAWAQPRPSQTAHTEHDNRRQEQSSRPSGNGSAPKGQYGEWRSAWGKTPPAPPSHWTRKGDWYRHVRACQQRYRSYNARTDAYRAYSGRTVRCKL